MITYLSQCAWPGTFFLILGRKRICMKKSLVIQIYEHQWKKITFFFETASLSLGSIGLPLNSLRNPFGSPASALPALRLQVCMPVFQTAF
jgi:hypothetical protein